MNGVFFGVIVVSVGFELVVVIEVDWFGECVRGLGEGWGGGGCFESGGVGVESEMSCWMEDVRYCGWFGVIGLSEGGDFVMRCVEG